MSERTARRWQSGALPATAKGPRAWRTREDPFGDVWESEVVPQLVADTEGRLQVRTLFRELCRRHPGRFEAGQLRTLQRRVREWRAQDGPDREVYFEQVAVPGREAAFDFTDASSLGVTIEVRIDGMSGIGVAVETPRGPVVESLMERGFVLHSINPKQLDRFRDRFSRETSRLQALQEARQGADEDGDSDLSVFPRCLSDRRGSPVLRFLGVVHSGRAAPACA